jgi:hypothetical protein
MRFVAAFLTAAIGCGGAAAGDDADASARPDAPAAPFAYAGVDRVVPARVPVVLSSQGSYDPYGLPLGFAWRFTSVPAGSQARIVAADQPGARFTPDVDGTYAVALNVFNPGAASRADVVIEAVNMPPVVSSIAAPASVAVGERVALSASGSDGNRDPLRFRWSLAARPPGSAATLADAGGATASFVADVEGRYDVAVIASDGRLETSPALFTVRASGPP